MGLIATNNVKWHKMPTTLFHPFLYLCEPSAHPMAGGSAGWQGVEDWCPGSPARLTPSLQLHLSPCRTQGHPWDSPQPCCTS